jgi:hypothetical protein
MKGEAELRKLSFLLLCGEGKIFVVENMKWLFSQPKFGQKT